MCPCCRILFKYHSLTEGFSPMYWLLDLAVSACYIEFPANNRKSNVKSQIPRFFPDLDRVALTYISHFYVVGAK